jgi:peptidoglycan/xylan/chitin deacetylase (PgdA/CDA1 family)
MIFFLTYHKVRGPAGGDDGDFYTVSSEQLGRQIEAMHARGFKCLQIDNLLAGKNSAEQEYILSFDDATPDHYDVVFPLLKKHGCRAVFFVPTSRLNQPGFLTEAQVRELARAGHTIGLHSHNHQRLDVLPPDKIREEMVRSQEILGGILGRKPVIFAPPGGFINGHVREAAVEQGVRIIRSMRWGYNQKPDLLDMETVPINRYTNEKKFLRIMESRNPRMLYAGKEALKRLIPLRFYQMIRRLAFKFSKSE